MRFIGIIPARYASTRFPGKPLATLAGSTVIERVYRQASKVLDHVFVATDDERIFTHVTDFGGKAVMTSSQHRSGTDRCREAYERCGVEADVVINIQGDEPFIREEQIRSLMQCFPTDIATLVQPFDDDTTIEELKNPNVVKVALSKVDMHALYFSRSVIPFLRDSAPETWASRQQYFRHIGMYAYSVDVLRQITTLPQGDLEKAESLEQLRWLENGYRIKVAISPYRSIGIDTPADLEAAEQYAIREGL